MKVLGLCFSDLHPDDIQDDSFAGNRTLAAVHFAGRYRLVDFALSNLVNAGVYHIGIIVNSQYQTLMAHIGTGRDWDLGRKSGGVTILPPYVSGEKTSYYIGNADDSHRVLQYLRDSASDYVILMECNMLYNIDYRDVIDAHEKSEADITAVYTRREVTDAPQHQSVVYSVSDNGRVHGVMTRNTETGMKDVSLNTFVMRTAMFMQLLSTEVPRGMWRFARDILAPSLHALKVVGYAFTGYTAHICSLDAYFRHNMEMLDGANRESLFNNEGRSVYTSVRDSTPTKYGGRATVTNSIVADGCLIEGTVENSIIFRNVRIGPGAVVRNSILMEDAAIQEGAMLEWIIMDKGVMVTENRVLMGCDKQPFYIPREKVI